MLDTAHRFCTLSEALGSEQSAWSKDRTLNYRAILAAMGTSGPADQLAQAIVRTASELKETRFFTLSAISGPVRLGLSAGLLQSGDTAASFLQAFEAAQHEFRQVGLRRARAYEAVTVLVHRSLRDRAPVTPEDAKRLKGIYEALKTHHWWLTGPEDLPACALLASRDGSPTQLGDETEAIYQALREAGHSGGETLQTAAMFLVLCHTSPAQITRRFTRLNDAFRSAGTRMFTKDQDEVALLCFLDRDPGTITRTVQAHREVIAAQSCWTGTQESFELAVSTAALELTRDNPDLLFVQKTKALLDLITAVNHQHAAIAGGAATAAT